MLGTCFTYSIFHLITLDNHRPNFSIQSLNTSFVDLMDYSILCFIFSLLGYFENFETAVEIAWFLYSCSCFFDRLFWSTKRPTERFFFLGTIGFQSNQFRFRLETLPTLSFVLIPPDAQTPKVMIHFFRQGFEPTCAGKCQWSSVYLLRAVDFWQTRNDRKCY